MGYLQRLWRYLTRRVSPVRFSAPRLRLEWLENRIVPTQYTVDLGGDAGVADPTDPNKGDLRYCLTQANLAAGNTVDFNFPGGGPVTIFLTSALPAINTARTLIDGSTEGGFAGLPIVEVRGLAHLGIASPGFTLNGGLDVLNGLIINGFDGPGVLIQQRPSDTVVNCFIGTDPTGTLASSTNVAGVTTVYSNTGNGVEIAFVGNNAIGGAAPGTGNLISDNLQIGVSVGSGLV